MVYMQLMQKPSPDPDQAAADSSWAGMADANPMADATGLASGPSSSDAASAMEGVVMNESHSKEGSAKPDDAANEKVSFQLEFEICQLQSAQDECNPGWVDKGDVTRAIAVKGHHMWHCATCEHIVYSFCIHLLKNLPACASVCPV